MWLEEVRSKPPTVIVLAVVAPLVVTSFRLPVVDPELTVVHVAAPDPFVVRTCPGFPSTPVNVTAPLVIVVPLTSPTALIVPVPVILLPARSKLPPNCGVVSSTTSLIPPVSSAISQEVPLYLSILPFAAPVVSTSVS